MPCPLKPEAHRSIVHNQHHKKRHSQGLCRTRWEEMHRHLVTSGRQVPAWNVALKPNLNLWYKLVTPHLALQLRCRMCYYDCTFQRKLIGWEGRENKVWGCVEIGKLKTPGFEMINAWKLYPLYKACSLRSWPICPGRTRGRLHSFVSKILSSENSSENYSRVHAPNASFPARR